LERHTVNKNIRDSWICFDKTFLGLELGKLFPARESLVSDIPAGDGNPLILFLQCKVKADTTSWKGKVKADTTNWKGKLTADTTNWKGKVKAFITNWKGKVKPDTTNPHILE